MVHDPLGPNIQEVDQYVGIVLLKDGTLKTLERPNPSAGWMGRLTYGEQDALLDAQRWCQANPGEAVAFWAGIKPQKPFPPKGGRA